MLPIILNRQEEKGEKEEELGKGKGNKEREKRRGRKMKRRGQDTFKSEGEQMNDCMHT